MRAHLNRENTEETVCAEQGVLSDIFGITAFAQQPACKVESGIDIRQHKLLKALPVFELSSLTIYSGL
jgi:hypothetical protein